MDLWVTVNIDYLDRLADRFHGHGVEPPASSGARTYQFRWMLGISSGEDPSTAQQRIQRFFLVET